jgi:type III restriction enzyme
MVLFENEELVGYLSSLEVKKSVYEYVVYDSEVEREFARRLDEREDIKLFVKLPRWFQVETPIGAYNPDWAILKHDGSALSGPRDQGNEGFPKLRTQRGRQGPLRGASTCRRETSGSPCSGPRRLRDIANGT